MSPFGRISTIHRADVTVPDDVAEAFADTEEFRIFSYWASELVAVSGSNRYSSHEEWGEGPTRRECEAFIDTWHNKILQWQAALRATPSSEEGV